MRLRGFAAGCLLAVALTGCGSGPGGAAGGTPSDPADKNASGKVASGNRDVDVTLRFRSSGKDYRMAFQVKVELGEPIDRQSVCELVEPERTVSVPVTITLVNTHQKEYQNPEEGQRWWEPDWLGVKPVSAPRGSLAWVRNTKSPLDRCLSYVDGSTIGSNDWEERSEIVVRGYLSGVPEGDRSGVGVKVSPVKTGEDASWDVDGDTKPFTVTY